MGLGHDRLSARRGGGRDAQGHGGLLERLDSLVFAAPIFFRPVVFHADAEVGSVRPEWIAAVLRVGW